MSPDAGARRGGLGRHEPLSWLDVIDAPELASIAALDAQLDITITALVAANPELDSGDAIPIETAPPPLWLAEIIVDAAATLRVYLERYDLATRRARYLAPEP